MLEATIGDWTTLTKVGQLPDIYDSYKSHALFIDEIELSDEDAMHFFVGVRHPDDAGVWPEFVVCQCYAPSGGGFNPGYLIVPETDRLFIGAGTRLLAYDVRHRKRLWEQNTNCGFLGWKRHKDFVLMSAELEFGVWSTSAVKLWSTFVEPPWSFELHEHTIELDVMGRKQSLTLIDGTTKEK